VILAGARFHLHPQVAVCQPVGYMRHFLHVQYQAAEGIGHHTDFVLAADVHGHIQITLSKTQSLTGHFDHRNGHLSGCQDCRDDRDDHSQQHNTDNQPCQLADRSKCLALTLLDDHAPAPDGHR